MTRRDVAALALVLAIILVIVLGATLIGGSISATEGLIPTPTPGAPAIP